MSPALAGRFFTTEPPSEVNITQSCLTLCDPMDYSPLGSSVHGILQATIQEWVAIPFSRASSHPGIEPTSPALQADTLLTEPVKCKIILLQKRRIDVVKIKTLIDLEQGKAVCLHILHLLYSLFFSVKAILMSVV